VKNPEQLIFMKNDVNHTALTLAIENSVISDLYGDHKLCIRRHPEMCERENKKQAESVKILLSYVSDKDAFICKQRVDGREILNYALHLDNAELLKILLDSVDNPEELLTMKDSEGKNLLMNAASEAKSKSIVVILRSVNNPEAFVMMKDSGGMTARTDSPLRAPRAPRRPPPRPETPNQPRAGGGDFGAAGKRCIPPDDRPRLRHRQHRHGNEPQAAQLHASRPLRRLRGCIDRHA
jgi:hypothetical protein